MKLFSALSGFTRWIGNSGDSPEKPSVPLDPDAWDERGWSGSQSDAGVRMTHRNAIGHPPILRGLNLICRGVAKLPMNVHRLGDNQDDSRIDLKHPAQYLLSKKPNDTIRAYVWKTTMLYHAVLRGNGYSAVLRRGATPAGLMLLNPITTEPFWIGDHLYYKVEAGNIKRKLPAEDVFHIRGLSYDGIVGHDILTTTANALGMGPAARKWISKLMSRGSTAGGLLQLPRELSPDARKKRQEEFEKYQSGLDNAFKTLALEDGAKWIRTMITPQEAAILDVLKLDVRMVANVLGLPPHKLGDDAKSSYNSLEQENKSYLAESLDPWCVELETEAADKLLTENEKRNNTHDIYIDRTALELGDMQSQANAFGKLTNDGLMLPDEARARMNLAPLPNGEGKKLRIPVNIAVDGVIASQSVASSNSDPLAEKQPDSPAMRNAVKSLLNERLNRLNKIAEKELPRASAKGDAAVSEFRNAHAAKIADALESLLPVLSLTFADGDVTRLNSARIATSLTGDGNQQAEQVISITTATPTTQEAA